LDKESRVELTSRQKAAIRNCFLSPDFQDGIILAITRMQEIEMNKLLAAESQVEIHRAQGGYNRLKLLVDFVQMIATLPSTDNERKPNV
jgi:hypothetical protein